MFYGIHDHSTNASPFSSVLYHETEKYRDDYIYDNYVRQYLYLDVYKNFGLSLDEFLNRPRDQIKKLVSILEDVSRKKAKINDNVLDDLKNASKDADMSTEK